MIPSYLDERKELNIIFARLDMKPEVFEHVDDDTCFQIADLLLIWQHKFGIENAAIMGSAIQDAVLIQGGIAA